MKTKQYILLIFCVCYFDKCAARIGFIKDQRTTHIKFPPIHTPQPGSVIPRGHLKALGGQRDPTDAVTEVDELPNPEEFYDEYVSLSRPVVFRNAMADVPAMQTWKKDSHLKKKYGNIIVQAVVAKGPYKKIPKKLTVREYLRDYNFLDWYLSNIIPKEMMQELVLPKMLKCGMTPYLQESEIWLTSGGTMSPAHSHADHNLHCLLAGRKDFVLYDPEYSEHLDLIPLPPHKGDGYSEIDTGMVNVFKYTRVKDAEWHWTTLKPGDCIYIPATYIHHVRSYGRSISSTFLWAPAPDVDFSECPSEDVLNEPVLLSDVPFIWTYYKADRELTDRHLDPPDLRRHLKVWMRDEPTLRYDVFLNYYDEIMSEMPAEEKPNAEMVWKLLSQDGENNITEISRSHIEGLEDSVLKQVAEYLNMPHALHGHDAEETETETETGEDDEDDEKFEGEEYEEEEVKTGEIEEEVKKEETKDKEEVKKEETKGKEQEHNKDEL